MLINSSRGEVVDNTVLLKAVRDHGLAAPILDVWENEPDINWDLLSRIEIGSPHIAGYAIDGKIKATLMIYEALCAALGTSPSSKVLSLSIPQTERILIDAAGRSEIDLLSDLCTQVYDLRVDHEHLQSLLRLGTDDRPAAFDHLRKTYPVRSGFQGVVVSLKNGTPRLSEQIAGLGFQLDIPR